LHTQELTNAPRISTENAMPAFGGRLSDDDIANVAAYVIDQATGDKW